MRRMAHLLAFAALLAAGAALATRAPAGVTVVTDPTETEETGGVATAEPQPTVPISLLGLGGPSFPLGDHDDHIRVGY